MRHAHHRLSFVSSLMTRCARHAFTSPRHRARTRTWLEELEPRQFLSVTLNPPTSIGAGVGPRAIATADLNGDGIADFVTADQTSSLITVNQSVISGGHTQSVYPTGVQPTAIAIANFDGDSLPEVAVVDQGNNLISLYHNTGNGLVPIIPLPTGFGPTSIVAADFNGDGLQDLLVTCPAASSFELYLGQGNEHFLGPLDNGMPFQPEQVAASDFDGDGQMDMALSNSGGITINLNNGAGIFTQVASVITGQSATALTAADVNGDGRPDLVATLSAQSGVDVMINNTDGTFTSTIYSITNVGQSVTVADVNADGKPDLVLAEVNDVCILENHGDGTFGPVANYPAGSIIFGAVVADANADGQPDVVATAFGDNAINALTNTGLAVSNATHLAFRPVPSLVGGPLLPGFQVIAADSDGGPDPDDSSTVTLALASGPRNAAPAGILTAQMVHGVATFPAVSLPTTGSYTFRAIDGSLTPAVSGSFATGGKLVVQTPKSATAGASTPVTVLIEDAKGHVQTSNHSAVTISVASGPGGITGTTTVTAVNGVATFSLGFTVGGIYTLAALSSAFATAPAKPFLCNAGAVSSMTALTTLSGSTVAGIRLAAQSFELFDSFGNVARTDHSNFTVSILSGPSGSSLTGTTTVHAAGGILTVSNLVLRTAGDYRLHISNGTAGIDTPSFTIAPAAAKKLVFHTQPSLSEAGAAIQPAVIVDILDSFGNLTTSTANVTLSSRTGVLAAPITIAAVGGEATFDGVIPLKAGTFTLKATASGLSTANSVSFTVQPPATHLVFLQQPTNTIIPGPDISPTVTVEVLDQFGHLVTADHTTVSLSNINIPDRALLGASAQVVNGIASFPILLVNQLGTFTLTASDGLLTAAQSNSFTIIFV